MTLPLDEKELFSVKWNMPMDLVEWFFALQAVASDYSKKDYVLGEVDRICKERYNGQFFDMPECIRGGLVDYVNGV